MMLTDTNPVHLHLLGELQFVEVFVVKMMSAFGVPQVRGYADPNAPIFLAEVVG